MKSSKPPAWLILPDITTQAFWYLLFNRGLAQKLLASKKKVVK